MPIEVYIAGPVLDRADPSERGLYGAIVSVVEASGRAAVPPKREQQLDQRPAREFVEEIMSRIRSSEYAVTVLSARDQSPPVEAAVASALCRRRWKTHPPLPVENAPPLGRG
jgi:hypothetical protein